MTPSPTWKNVVEFPRDSFAASATYEPRWIKLTILLCDPDTVYFQDSNQYRFHYDFAVEHLDPLANLDRDTFDAVTLHADGQQAVLGAVLFEPGPFTSADEIGIQLLRNDAFSVDEIVTYFELVRSKINAGPEVDAFYFPTYLQQPSAEAQSQALAQRGVIVSSPERWQDNACYSYGWALGELMYFTVSEIPAAVRNGQLRPEHILLTDGEPAELPPVAGIVTLSPVTPSSHVAILAQTLEIPFVSLAWRWQQEEALALVGHTVTLRSRPACQADLVNMEGYASQAQLDELLELKQPRPILYPPMAFPGTLSASADTLDLDDMRYFGGKAASFGLLRRAIPQSSPKAVAISFDLWTSFLDQTLTTGQTLRQEISSRLSAFSYPPDMATLLGELEEIRSLIRDPGSTSFSPADQAEVLALLQDPSLGFDRESRLRFRSSTNLEDTEHFTGAGLYDSYSGCLADELDGDDQGPSRCDPTRQDERGVFRAIRRVFASFYNDYAVLTRLRHRVAEEEVGMALLVHHSFSDEIELANGVATFVRSDSGRTSITTVTQPGAHPVTNPQPGTSPEVVLIDIRPRTGDRFLIVKRHSNLVILGEMVLQWRQDYEDLADLLVAVADRFEQETGRAELNLEFEFKKVAPDGNLVVKQVRQLPMPDRAPSQPRFLVGVPTEYCVEMAGVQVTTVHRLKTIMTLQTASYWLTQENLQQRLFTEVAMNTTAGCSVASYSGPVSELPDAEYLLVDGQPTLKWSQHQQANPETVRLSLFSVQGSLTDAIAATDCPVVIPSDLGIYLLSADYEQPELTWTGDQPGSTTNEVTRLQPCSRPTKDDLLQNRIFGNSSGVTISTTFCWPPVPFSPGLIFVGYTAPLSYFVETVIDGLTSEPLVLSSPFSQSYAPTHHNASEDFFFDPWLDPETSRQQLQELQELGVRFIGATTRRDNDDQIRLFADLDDCSLSDVPQPRRPRGRRR